MPSRKGKPNKIKDYYVLEDIYNKYIQDVTPGSRYDMTFKQFKLISTSLLGEAMSYILDAGELRLGFNLGTLRIKKCKNYSHGRKRDHKASNELGKLVYHLNLHTNGYYVKFYWRKKAVAKVTNIRVFSFIPNRLRNRELSKLFATGQTDYFE